MTDPFNTMTDALLGGILLALKSFLQLLLEPIVIPLFGLLNLFQP